jgi:hypothetical protein
MAIIPVSKWDKMMEDEFMPIGGRHNESPKKIVTVKKKSSYSNAAGDDATLQGLMNNLQAAQHALDLDQIDYYNKTSIAQNCHGSTFSNGNCQGKATDANTAGSVFMSATQARDKAQAAIDSYNAGVVQRASVDPTVIAAHGQAQAAEDVGRAQATALTTKAQGSKTVLVIVGVVGAALLLTVGIVWIKKKGKGGATPSISLPGAKK